MRLSLPSQSGFTWRLILVVTVLAFLFGYFVFRLFNVQVVQHLAYAEAAEAQSTSTKVQQAQRGQILARDRDGKIYTLAASEERYQLSVAPQQVPDKTFLAKELKILVPALNEGEVFQRIDNDKVYVPPLIKGLSREKADEIIKEKYKGVYVEPELVRVYPEGAAIAAQILGYVGSDGQGKYGVEAVYDSLLRGVAGSELAKKDSFGRLIDILGGELPEAGKDILLTVDYNLQYIVERELSDALKLYGAEAGSVVVMDAKTGAVLALAGQPTFDPNTYSKVETAAQGVFLAPAASAAYEAGSVVKPLTMAMAIDLGLVEPETEEVFGGSVTVGDYEIKNADDKIFGRETMTQVLENSDNVAMVWLSQKLGLDNQYSYLKKFGFGEKTEVGLTGEQRGIVRDREDWNETLGATAAFGQGFSNTVVQLAKAYATIANGGTAVQPHLVFGEVQGNSVKPVEYPTLGAVVKPETAGKIQLMMESVVVNGHGKKAQVAGVRVAGKTGTAQVASPLGGYEEDRFIGNFAGFFPVDNPQFVMVVRLDNPRTVRFAESSAAPVFGKIGEWMANYYHLR
ncbi:MAG: penicillin-binding protein 2 [Patescibacteria group bacterium]